MAATALIGAGIAYGAKESHDARKEARDSNARQEQQLREQINREEETATTTSQRRQASYAAAARQRASAGAAGGRSSTILTGPLGLPGDNTQGQQKKLLGQ